MNRFGWVVVSIVLCGCSSETPRVEDAAEKPVAQAQAGAEAKPSVKRIASTDELSTVAPQKIADDDYTITPSGLMYYDFVVGDGAQPRKGQHIKVHYTGWLTDGKRFDSSVIRDQPLLTPIGVGRVIRGWDEGMMSMREGGKRQLVIPSQLAYGQRGRGGIPPSATLIFEVELLDVIP